MPEENEDKAHPFEKEYHVMSGPSKYELAMALCCNNLSLRFVVRERHGYPEIPIEFRILGGDRASDDSDNLELRGMAVYRGKEFKVKIIYRANVEKGTIIKF